MTPQQATLGANKGVSKWTLMEVILGEHFWKGPNRGGLDASCHSLLSNLLQLSPGFLEGHLKAGLTALFPARH